MKIIFCFVILFISPLLLPAQQISDYNVVWNSPSLHSGGSMPLGNGEMGMNIWVEEGGDLLFYLSRTDAISEANRLMKVGRVRISITPNPFEAGIPFTQKLLLEEGLIEINAGKEDNQTKIKIYLDPDQDVAYTTINSDHPIRIKSVMESWRRTPHTITHAEDRSAWTIRQFPKGLHFEESCDIFPKEKGAIVWFHKNEESVYDVTMRHQKKEEVAHHFPDPIKGRVFGAYMTARNLERVNDSTFQSENKVTSAELKIATHSKQVSSEEEWLEQIKKINTISSPSKALKATHKWWKEFWSKSYILVDIPNDKEFGFKLTQGYLTQRFMNAAGGRGHFPIKFNGSIFTFDPSLVKTTINFTPDYRDWGNEFWWQNTRLPYYSMLQTGDFELMVPLFKFYLDRMDAMRTLASKYYGAKGFFIPEVLSIFGTYGNSDYGWNRTGLSPNVVASKWIGQIWVQSLELSKIMLDYASYTGDTKFLVEQVLPTANEALLYFESRFMNEKGKIHITPTQSLETYWTGVVNDMPTVAGLHYLVRTLKQLPENIGTAEDRTFWDRMARSLPPLPIDKKVAGGIFIPAEEFLNKRSNVENPELYVVFPFGLENFTTKGKDVAIRTFENRYVNSQVCWGQDGQICAMLGLQEQAIENLKLKIANTNKNSRFPAMWGPNYDWVPDQDHGGNLLLTLQLMVMQNYDDKSFLLPVWDKSWNVSFKLAAPGQTKVKGVYKNGKLSYEKLSGSSEVVPLK